MMSSIVTPPVFERIMLPPAKCRMCSCDLSQYREPQETYCLPCQKSLGICQAKVSLQEIHRKPKVRKPTRQTKRKEVVGREDSGENQGVLVSQTGTAFQREQGRRLKEAGWVSHGFDGRGHERYYFPPTGRWVRIPSTPRIRSRSATGRGDMFWGEIERRMEGEADPKYRFLTHLYDKYGEHFKAIMSYEVREWRKAQPDSKAIKITDTGMSTWAMKESGLIDVVESKRGPHVKSTFRFISNPHVPAYDQARAGEKKPEPTTPVKGKLQYYAAYDDDLVIDLVEARSSEEAREKTSTKLNFHPATQGDMAAFRDQESKRALQLGENAHQENTVGVSPVKGEEPVGNDIEEVVEPEETPGPLPQIELRPSGMVGLPEELYELLRAHLARDLRDALGNAQAALSVAATDLRTHIGNLRSYRTQRELSWKSEDQQLEETVNLLDALLSALEESDASKLLNMSN